MSKVTQSWRSAVWAQVLAAGLLLIAMPGLAGPINPIVTVAGNGTKGFSGDGGPATMAELAGPIDVFADGVGNLLIADQPNNRIREVTPDGVITTVAGSGIPGFSGDGGPALTASLTSPVDVIEDSTGDLFISDTFNNRIRKVSPNRVISTIAGNGQQGTGGVGGLAAVAQLNQSGGLAVDAQGNLLIADSYNNRILKVGSDGIITLVAGSATGEKGFTGDGGPATTALLNYCPFVAVDSGGDIYIADVGNSRVRKVSPNGTITTIAGNGILGSLGDGGPAATAELNGPDSVVVDASGNVFISEAIGNRVRMIDTSGVITTIAGTGVAGYSGDGGPAATAQLNEPLGLALDGKGHLYVADEGNHAVRMVTLPAPTQGTVAVKNVSGSSGQTVQLEIDASSGVRDIAGADLIVQFGNAGTVDPASVVAGPILAGGLLTVNLMVPGQIRIGAVSNASGSGPGALALFSLKISPTALGSYPLAAVRADLNDPLGNHIPTQPVSGTLIVSPPSGICGDLNGDGNVNVADATIALRIGIGLAMPTAQNTAGACGNTINVAFATRVLRVAIGIGPPIT